VEDSLTFIADDERLVPSMERERAENKERWVKNNRRN